MTALIKSIEVDVTSHWITALYALSIAAYMVGTFINCYYEISELSKKGWEYFRWSDNKESYLQALVIAL